VSFQPFAILDFLSFAAVETSQIGGGGMFPKFCNVSIPLVESQGRGWEVGDSSREKSSREKSEAQIA
jgi:hypothetical protein